MPRISQLNKLPDEEKRNLYRLLVPPTVCKRFDIDPKMLQNPNSGCVFIDLVCPADSMEASLDIKHEENKDSIFYIELSDSNDYTQLQWDFINVNDPECVKYATDVDAKGKSRWLNWHSRNLPEELRAMEIGLAPGQTRCGMRLMKEINQCLDDFCRAVGLKSILLEALFYHTAIQFERHGYRYFRGIKMMRRINELFQPGRAFHQKLDGSDFRKPEFANSIRGRSWAIHDGVIEEVDDHIADMWEPPVMYRMVGERHEMNTFPEGVF